MENLIEVLTADDPVEKWIADFVKSDNPKFDGKSKKERIKMALGAFYAAKDKTESVEDRRAYKIVSLATDSADHTLIRYFVESNEGVASRSLLVIKDLWEDFCNALVETSMSIAIGSESKIKCVIPWGECLSEDIYSGHWKQSACPNELRLELDKWTGEPPTIFYNKSTKQVSIPKNFKLI